MTNFQRHLIAAFALLFIGAQSTHPIDGDGDGVPDGEDRCAATPLGARPISMGCSAIELIASPDLVGGSARSKILFAADNMGLGVFDRYDAEVEGVGAGLFNALEWLDSGLSSLRRGEVCPAADDFTVARHTMEAQSRASHGVLLDVREELQRRVSPTDPDADFQEVAFHELGYRASLVGDALVAMRHTDEVAQAICDQIVRPSRWSGIVARTDDAARMLALVDGPTFVVPEGADMTALREGASVSLRGSLLDDATGIAESIGPLYRDTGSLDAGRLPAVLLSCIKLQIAPFQPFNPPLPISPTYVLHDTLAYQGTIFGTDVLELEAPMRLAAASTGLCPTTSGSGGRTTSIRHTLKIEFLAPGASGFDTIVSDLDTRDAPISLPVDVIPVGSQTARTGTLRVTEQRQACIGSFPRQRCSAEVEPGTVTDYVLFVLKRGEYGALQYGRTLYDLDDGDPNSFRAAVVTGVSFHPLLTGLPITFRGEGRSPSGTRAIVAVDSGFPFFAVHNDDFGDGVLFSLSSIGTDQRSALRWPRIVGTRNGREFWYSAKLPFIVRDLVDTCTPGPHSFYRLPWANGATINVGQGNSSPFSHTVGSSQEFAFDFGLSDGTSIRAARGGTVDWFTESQTTTFDPTEPMSPTNQPFPAGALTNWGNAVRIAHQDGTFSWYFHIKTNRVFVEVGDQVVRGQVIAEADNTGRSSGPHLHYQVQGDNINWGQSIQIRFDTASHGDCYIPQTGDNVTSNNN